MPKRKVFANPVTIFERWIIIKNKREVLIDTFTHTHTHTHMHTHTHAHAYTHTHTHTHTHIHKHMLTHTHTHIHTHTHTYTHYYLLYFAWADQRVKQFYSVKKVVIELWLGSYIYRTLVRVYSYRTVVLLTHFYQRNTFIYSINVLNFKRLSSVNTSLSVKYLKHCHFVCMKVYSSW